MQPEEYDAVSKRLVDARLNAEALPDFPIRLPESLEQAYAIQAASIARWPDEIAGWKVAKMTEADATRLSAERLAGPTFKSAIHTIEPGACTVVPIFDGGFAAVEAEFVLELGETVPPSGKEYSDEELIDIVATAYCGVEMAGSPMAVVNERGATAVVSDFGNNAGIVVGPRISDWQNRPPGLVSVSVTIDGDEVGSSTADAIVGSALQALRFLINLSGSRGIELPAGIYVATGAITGVHNVQMDSIACIDFGPFGSFDLAFEPIAPVK